MLSKRRAEGTLLGVAPPRSEDAAPARPNPVVVHAGVLPADEKAPPVAPSEGTLAAAAPASVAPAAPVALSLAPEPVHDEELLYPSLAPSAGLEAPVPPPFPWQTDSNPDAIGRDDQQCLQVPQALKLRVRVFGGQRPFWMLLVPASVALFGVATLLGSALGGRHSAPPPAVSAPAPAPVINPVVAPPQPTLDLAAIQAKAPETRTVVEALALANQGVEQKREAAAKRARELLQTPANLRKKAALAELHKLASDPVTAPPTLVAVADLPGSPGPDLLYELWSGAPNKSDAAELSRALLLARDMRSKASDALSIVLQLRAVEAYADLGPLLERARQVGDKRVLAALKKWKHKRPCSATNQHDCCPRELTKLIDTTIGEVKGRRSPFDVR